MRGLLPVLTLSSHEQLARAMAKAEDRSDGLDAFRLTVRDDYCRLGKAIGAGD